MFASPILINSSFAVLIFLIALLYAYYRINKESKTGKEGRHLGLDAQESIVTHYYNDIGRTFTEIKSGKTITERPELNKATAYCLKHGYTLVVAKLDRLSRSVEDCLYIWKQLKGRDRFCDIPGAADKFTITMYAAFAERERELIALRTSQAIKAKIKRGESWSKGNPDFISGKVANIGMKASIDKADNNENNIRASAMICSKVNEGLTFVDIAAYLNKKKYKTGRGKSFILCRLNAYMKSTAQVKDHYRLTESL